MFAPVGKTVRKMSEPLGTVLEEVLVMHTLLTSYNGLHAALLRNKITLADVSDPNTLFAFAAMRKAVFEEDFEVRWDSANAREWHKALLEALLVAEREGRVVWREDSMFRPAEYWSSISALLWRIDIKIFPAKNLSASEAAIADTLAPFQDVLRVVY